MKLKFIVVYYLPIDTTLIVLILGGNGVPDSGPAIGIPSGTLNSNSRPDSDTEPDGNSKSGSSTVITANTRIAALRPSNFVAVLAETVRKMRNPRCWMNEKLKSERTSKELQNMNHSDWMKYIEDRSGF